MRQEVKALVAITYDADATLTAEQLRQQIKFDLTKRLIWGSFTGLPVEAVEVEVEDIREEAEIYGNEA